MRRPSRALRAELSAVLNRRRPHHPSRPRGAQHPTAHTTRSDRGKGRKLSCLTLLYHFSPWEESWQTFINFPPNSLKKRGASLGQTNFRDWFNWLTFQNKIYEQCHFKRRLKPPSVLLGTVPWSSLQHGCLIFLPINQGQRLLKRMKKMTSTC